MTSRSTFRSTPESADPATLALLERLRDARFPEGLVCPHCAGRSVIRWGRFSGRQRYRCSGCLRTFSDLTATPLYYSKRLLLWPAFARCMAEQLTVRRAAARLGLHPETAWRWRHRFLGALLEEQQGTLGGLIEVWETWLPCKERGQTRFLYRGFPGSGWTFSVGRRFLALALDRNGESLGIVILGGMARQPEILLPFARLIDSGSTVLDPRGPRGLFYRSAPRLGCDRLRVRGAEARAHPLHHCRNVRRLAGSIRAWLRRFRCVGGDYLVNYLTWHRLIVRGCTSAQAERFLLVAVRSAAAPLPR